MRNTRSWPWLTVKGSGIADINKNMEERRMKVFNLEAAKTGKPVCTRDGRMVRIICFDRKSLNNHFPMLALIDDGDGEEVLESYQENGKNGFSASDRDLFMLPEKHEGWVNILCNDDNGIYAGHTVYATKVLAEESARYMNEAKLVATVKIEWEE